MYAGSGHVLVEKLLKSGESLADVGTQVGYGVVDGVVILEAQERGQLGLVELFHPYVDVVRQDEIEEDLLLAVEVRGDLHLGLARTLFPTEGWQGVGDVGENVEEIAFLGVDDLLHLGQLVGTEAFFSEPMQQLGSGVGRAP